MKHAHSYQTCVQRDEPLKEDAYWNSLAIAVAETICDDYTESDVCISAFEIAYRINRQKGWMFSTSPDDVKGIADAAVHYKQTGVLP